MYRIDIQGGKVSKTSWDGKKRAYVREPVESLVPYLNCPVTIEDTTFGQFFSLIGRDLDFYTAAYSSATLGIPLGPLVDEIQRPSEKPLRLECVEVYWSAEIEEGRLDEFASFHGWGDWGDVPEGTPSKGGIAIEFSPLNEYKDAPLRLNDEYEIFANFKPVFKTKKGFRVHDVVLAILWELTWAGDISGGRKAPFDNGGE